jgi:hypothetical protein
VPPLLPLQAKLLLHAVAQQMNPPWPLSTHAPVAHWSLPVHGCPCLILGAQVVAIMQYEVALHWLSPVQFGP